jgi:hypothetical protein
MSFTIRNYINKNRQILSIRDTFYFIYNLNSMIFSNQKNYDNFGKYVLGPKYASTEIPITILHLRIIRQKLSKNHSEKLRVLLVYL